jgi:hypothetical protein
VLIDFNSRYWSSVQGSEAMGVNFPLLATAVSLGMDVAYPDYRTGHFFFSTTAFKTILKNLFSKEKIPVRIRDTQLQYVLCDPFPEIAYLLGRFPIMINRLFRKSSENTIQ